MCSLDKLVGCFVGCAAIAAMAAPEISNVSVEQAPNRKLVVNYNLSEPAIVMVEFFDGDTSLGDEPLRDGFVGDAFQPVAAGARSFTWNARKVMPNREYSNFKVRLTPVVLSEAPEWMVVDLVKGGGARYYDRESLLIGGSHKNDAYKSTHLLLRRIPAAGVSWCMGSQAHDASAGNRAVPHLVTLSEDYYLGVYEVTQDQLRKWNSSASFNFEGSGDLPAESVSYEDCRGETAGHNWPKDDYAVDGSSFFGFLRDRGAQRFDLPTDAQWEYGARGGSARQYYNGMYSTNGIDAIAWYIKNSSNATSEVTHPVGQKLVNPFGLYDVAGNVAEWCLDWCQDKLPLDNAYDPIGPVGGDALDGNGYSTSVTLTDGSVVTTGRIIHGGAVSWDEKMASHAYRNYYGVKRRDRRIGLRVCAPAMPMIKN